MWCNRVTLWDLQIIRRIIFYHFPFSCSTIRIFCILVRSRLLAGSFLNENSLDPSITLFKEKYTKKLQKRVYQLNRRALKNLLV
ncbi:hypothetical protein RCL_jg14969.t1 [Rhizophagus clarus]|uniref:Uncharacterized protein n=1 Tax=Rhizophagus clarus TaxID=94130 RepID=A0A8H3R0N6_9GLOM|nr:hypothetical protein RCL_jg14969.t1 [Rhizophagus clarus]